MARTYSPGNSPEENFKAFAEVPYKGRGFIEGFVGNRAVQFYFLEGRSEGSDNRFLLEEDGIVSTEVFDPAKKKGDPELTIYDAMRRRKSVHIVSNGKQTDVALSYLRSHESFESAMNTQTYEPDPLSTPRISGFVDTYPAQGEPYIGVSIIRKVPVSSLPVRTFYTDQSHEFRLEDGVGVGVHTYKGEDADNPQSFDEVPITLPLEDTAEGMLELGLTGLNPEITVAAVAKVIDVKTGEVSFKIYNAHEEGDR
jgi:IMP cyclohydrolase